MTAINTHTFVDLDFCLFCIVNLCWCLCLFTCQNLQRVSSDLWPSFKNSGVVWRAGGNDQFHRQCSQRRARTADWFC